MKNNKTIYVFVVMHFLTMEAGFLEKSKKKKSWLPLLGGLGTIQSRSKSFFFTWEDKNKISGFKILTEKKVFSRFYVELWRNAERLDALRHFCVLFSWTEMNERERENEREKERERVISEREKEKMREGESVCVCVCDE